MEWKSSKLRMCERGSALVYILIAIALLAALTVSFMEPSSQQTTSQNAFRTVATVRGQVDVILSTIQECVLLYPNGDNTIDTSVSGSDPGARTNYPINPDSTHFTSAALGRAGDRLVRNIRCPGNITTGSAYDHAAMFSGNSGKFLPPKPELFEEWQYYNGTDGVYFWTETDKTDAFIESALEKLDENYAECEADVINASSGAVDLDSAATALTQCPSGHLCFRVRMIINPSSEYNGDNGNDETACP